MLNAILVVDESGTACVGPCFTCGVVMLFNPWRVPSLPAEVNGTGTRQPICVGCCDRATPVREARRLPPIVPLPGAYEPEPEVSSWA